ncbi:MAG: DUF3821 domain-containing protein, partial [Methanoregula sp.]|nr:DUF3821 domain-containing protein [Methanoregula sp.]
MSPNISQGATVFIGEQGLNLQPAIDAFSVKAGYTPTSIGWWAPASNPDTNAPDRTYTLTTPSNTLIAPATFVSYYGSWYPVDFTSGHANTSQGEFFIVADPSIDLGIWDFTTGSDKSGLTVNRGDYLGFRVVTNMASALNATYRSPVYNSTLDGYIDIKVTNETGTVFTALCNSSGQENSLLQQNVSTPSWTWGNVASAPFNWSTAAVNSDGHDIYLPGTYTVIAESLLNNMKVNYLSGGAAYVGKTVSSPRIVTLLAGPPIASFTANVTIGTAPLGVQFNDTSTGSPTNWNWSFGDGNYTSVQNPVYTYPSTGTFTVALNATNASGSNISTRANYITVYPPVPVAAFSANTTSGYIPLPVQFTDASTNTPTGWAWFFGDENYTAPWTRMNASAGWTGRSGHSSVVLPDGSIVLMGGSNSTGRFNDTWRSTTMGATWTLMNASAGWSARSGHISVVMPDGSIVLMGGDSGSLYHNDTWRSTDNGATWTLMNASSGWLARDLFCSAAMPDGSIVLLGGEAGSTFKNDTWKSLDYGATWTMVNASGGWTARLGSTCEVMPDSSIVLMGGYDGSSILNDTWRSTDNGITWTRMNISAGWSARFVPGSVAVPDGTIILMGGYDGVTLLNDTWQSKDNGLIWALVNASAGWTGRAVTATGVLPDCSIVLMGGSLGTGLYVNDVWRFVPTGSSVQNASHTYASPGSFQVSLQAYNAGGYNSTRKLGYINVSSSPTTGSVHNQNTGLYYTTIQAAINNATSSDIILIDSGTYFENVNISKPLTVRGNDTGTGLPIIDGRGNSGIVPFVSDCTIEQIRIRNATASWAGGIAPSMVLTANLTVRNTTITGSFSGIYLADVNNSVISDVTVTNCTYGLLFSFVHKTNIDNGTFLGTTESVDGITLWTSTENVFSRTAVEGFPHYGINLDSDNNHNRFIASNVSDSLIGFSIAGNSFNTTIDQSYAIANTDQGIVFHNSNNN